MFLFIFSTALKARLSDSNQKILTTTLYTISLLCQATGPAFDKSAKIVIPAMLGNLADNKKPIRDAALQTMDNIINDITLEAFVSFLPAAMALDSSLGRKEVCVVDFITSHGVIKFYCQVLQWVMKHLPTFKPKPATDLTVFIKPLLACLQDKQGDVRHLAEQVLTETVKHVGMDVVRRESKDLKPAVQQQIGPILEKLGLSAGALKQSGSLSATTAAPAVTATVATATTTTTTATASTAPTSATNTINSAPPSSGLSTTQKPTTSSKVAAKSVPPISVPTTPNSSRTARATTPSDDDRSSSSSSSSARSSKSASPPKSRSPTRMKAKIDEGKAFLN